MDVTTMTDQELADDYALIAVEQARRASIAAAPIRIAGIIGGLLDATGREDGAEWVQPSGAYDAYPRGWTVAHNGNMYTATRDGASGEPGVVTADWTQIVTAGTVTAWVQPMAGQEYPVGVEVTYQTHLWRNDLGSPNGFIPGATGSGWTDLGVAP